MAILRLKDENGNIIEVPAIKGDSAYEVWLAQGNVGTEADFIASLRGEKYTLTDEDKTDIANIVMSNFIDVSEVAL